MALSLEKIRDRYYEHSKQASELTRTLAISGIATIWVFREGVEGAKYTFDDASLIAGLLFSLTLLADLLHYVVGAALYSSFAAKKEREGVKEASIPSRITETVRCIWYLKVLFLIVGFLVLAFGLAQRAIYG